MSAMTLELKDATPSAIGQRPEDTKSRGSRDTLAVCPATVAASTALAVAQTSSAASAQPCESPPVHLVRKTAHLEKGAE